MQTKDDAGLCYCKRSSLAESIVQDGVLSSIEVDAANKGWKLSLFLLQVREGSSSI